MGDMRFRLRQAIYGMALKKFQLPRCSHPDCGPVDNYEEFLLDHFISQISGTVENVENGPQSTPRGHRSERPVAKAREVVRLREPLSNNNQQESQKVAIALETYTTGPVKKHSGKLITADDFRMFDSPAASNENSTEEVRDRIH
ncbi:unnamed protein product [Haemonchus placei]|uniref:Uncharacterized protein n=1 Tax=Haemonchus placei TaxID=6290 RepID=A0A0N4VYF9_HAEPC|nr:unnamed protein product [Haemonchus placei]